MIPLLAGSSELLDALYFVTPYTSSVQTMAVGPLITVNTLYVERLVISDGIC